MKSDATNKRRMMAVFLAVSLSAAACGGSNDESGRDAEENFSTTIRQSGDDGSSDDSTSLEDDAMSDDEAMSDDGSGDGSVDLAQSDDAMEGDGGEEADSERSFGATTVVPSAAPDASGEFGSDRSSQPAEAPNPPRIRPFVDVDDDPLSTFALDVDTGSYSLARNQLNNGQRPDPDAVRVEEFVNSFDYSYANPTRRTLGISVDGAPSPFDADNYLLRIGVQGERVRDEDRPTAHLTFVVDTSGSMDTVNRLPLVQESLRLLVDELEDDDTLAIVTYNNRGDILLQPTSVRDDDTILDAIDSLRPGGSTNLEAGLQVGYELAREVNEDGDINRVIVASDGLANAGVTDVGELGRQIRSDADNGIRLMTVGYGLNGFNDETMEQLADQSDGVYAYVDTIDEAEEVFENNLTANLYTIAIDAKIQVEFEEDVVDRYRLIGFENRGVRDQDFTNNDVDAGEIGAGHQVTALYEIRLQRGVRLSDSIDKLAEINLRWETTRGGIIEIDESVRLGDVSENWSDSSDEFKLAGTVGVFAEMLRDSQYAETVDWTMVENEARFLSESFNRSDVDEFYSLVQQAGRI